MVEAFFIVVIVFLTAAAYQQHKRETNTNPKNKYTGKDGQKWTP